MRKAIPTSHRALMLFLQTVLIGVQEYAGLARPHLHPETVQAVAELLSQYTRVHRAVTQGNARRKSMYQTVNNHILLLEGQLDALWAGVRSHVRAHQATPDLYGYYGLTQEGNLVRPRKRAETMALAVEVLAGHEEAQQMGFSVVDAMNLAQALATAQGSSYTLQQVAKTAHDAVAKRKELRQEARLLYREVSAEMHRALLRHPEVYRREVMRKYGFAFKSDGTTSNTSANDAENNDAENNDAALEASEEQKTPTDAEETPQAEESQAQETPVAPDAAQNDPASTSFVLNGAHGTPATANGSVKHHA